MKEASTTCERAVAGNEDAQMEMWEWFNSKGRNSVEAVETEIVKPKEVVIVQQATTEVQMAGKKRPFEAIYSSEDGMASCYMLFNVDMMTVVSAPAAVNHAHHLHAQNTHGQVMTGVRTAFFPAVPYVGTIGGLPGVPVANVLPVTGIAQVPQWVPHW